MSPMKNIGFLVAVLFGCIGFISDVQAFMLEEQQLFTKNKGCFINYLTEKNTNGWYIETDREECDKEGYLSGYHKITVYNAFSKPIERLRGHFSNGYWTGDTFLKNVKFYRMSEELGKQKAVFDIYNDTENDVRYIGQMMTQKTDAGTYPPFRVCNPFRIMGVVKDISRLDDPHYLQLIFNQVIKQIRQICPVDEKAMLFLSYTDKPQQEDIVIFVQMDLKSRRHKIIRAGEVIDSVPSVNTSTFPVSNQIMPVESEQIMDAPSQTIEVKDTSAGALDIDSVTLDDLSEEVLSDLTAESDEEYVQETVVSQPQKVVQSATKKTRTETVKTNIDSVVDKQSINDTEKELIERNAARAAASFFNSSGDMNEPADLNVFQQRRSYLQPLKVSVSDEQIDSQIANAGVVDISATRWPLAHIMLLSKVLNSPVLAQTAVHVERVKMDGTGIIDLPLLADVRDGYIASGWNLVKGYYIAYKSSAENVPVGMIRLIEATKCTLPLCQEKK